jgi:predicted phosphodiesterase
MIYVTGDCHRDFSRFIQEPEVSLEKGDYVIVCGDFGLLWVKDKNFERHLSALSELPYTILWVQGNHENYNMIEEYPVEMWKGGKVRHIVRDKIILLERGQVFEIEGKTFFTFGGASSHDIQGGILNRGDPAFEDLRMEVIRSGLPYRILNESWWKQELPTEKELQEGRDNLKKVNYKVDYVISHCASNRIQYVIEKYYSQIGFFCGMYQQDILTNYFEELEDALEYKHWYFGHYHDDKLLDEKHSVLYFNVLPLDYYEKYLLSR